MEKLKMFQTTNQYLFFATFVEISALFGHSPFQHMGVLKLLALKAIAGGP
jgi:hypothetical protein